jgi:hypothetical protein
MTSARGARLRPGTSVSWVDYWPTSHVEQFAGCIDDTPEQVSTSSPLTGLPGEEPEGGDAHA